MTRRLHYGRGRVQIKTSDTFSRLARRALENVHPGLLGVIEDGVDQVAAEARAGWPRKTGRSGDAIESGARIVAGGDRLEGFIRNPVKYAVWVRPKGSRSYALTLYVKRPMRKLMRTLGKRLGEEAIARLDGGR